MAAPDAVTTIELKRRFRPKAMESDDAARAHSLGWNAAQTDYLARERERARQAMAALIASCELRPPLTSTAVRELIEIAFDMSGPRDVSPGTIRRRGADVLVSIDGCPVQESPRAQAMCSERVCPYWHRRQGWIEAAGVQADDARLPKQEWLPGSCTSLMVITEPPASPEPDR